MITSKDFEKVYKQHSLDILHLCLNYVGDEAKAKDLTQETFTIAWQRRHKFKEDSKISTWIYRIAVNTCLMNLRRDKKKTRMFDGQLPKLAQEETADNTEDIKFLRQCIRQLKETERLIITMVLEEKPYTEIAEIMGVSENNLRVKIYRIKKELTKNFKEHGRL